MVKEKQMVKYKQTELWHSFSKEEAASLRRKSRLFVAGVNKLIEADVRVYVDYPDGLPVRVDRIAYERDGAAKFVVVYPYPCAEFALCAPLVLDIETAQPHLLVRSLE